MSTYQIALLLHIVGAISYFVGIGVAAFAFLEARRQERPSQVAAVLGLARTGVLVAGVGMLLILGFGFWLIDQAAAIDMGDAWIGAALALFVAAAALGGIAGQAPKRARKLAVRLSAEGDRPSEELRRLLDDRPSLVLNVVSGLAAVAVLVLMVWQPGG